MKSINKKMAAFVLIIFTAASMAGCMSSFLISDEEPVEAELFRTAVPETQEEIEAVDIDIIEIQNYMPDDGTRIEISESGMSDHINKYMSEQSSGWVYSHIEQAEISITTYGEFEDKKSKEDIQIGYDRMVFEASNGHYYMILQEMDYAKPNHEDNPTFYIVEAIPNEVADSENQQMYYNAGMEYHIDYNSDNILEAPMATFESYGLAYTFSQVFESHNSEPNIEEITVFTYFVEGIIEGDINIDYLIGNTNMWYREETDALNGFGFNYGNHEYFFELRLGNDDEDRPIDYEIDELILVHNYAYVARVLVNPTVEEMIEFYNGEIEGEINNDFG